MPLAVLFFLAKKLELQLALMTNDDLQADLRRLGSADMVQLTPGA